MVRWGVLLERGLAPAGACTRWRQREKDPVDFVSVYASPVSPAGQDEREKESLESGGGGAVVPSAARTLFRCEREGRGEADEVVGKCIKSSLQHLPLPLRYHASACFDDSRS